MKNRLALTSPATLLGIFIACTTTACNDSKGTTGVGNPPMYSVGVTDLSDSAITSRIKAAIFLNEDLKSIRIDVSTNEGKVTLEGWVDTNSQVEHAIRIAEGTEGVRSVRNELMSSKR